MREDDHRTVFTVDEILSRGERARLRAVGELDFATSDVLEAALDEQLAMPHTRVGVDLTELTFCDGAGLSMLDRLHTRFGAAGGELTLTGVPAQLVKLMEITSMRSLMNSSTGRAALPHADEISSPAARKRATRGSLHAV